MFFERKGESIKPAVGFEIFTTQAKEKEDGHFEDELVGNIDIPDPRLFKLDYLLQNNVSMQQVNTKILGGSFEDLGETDSGVFVNSDASATDDESAREKE